MKVHNRFIKAFGALLIAALLFAALPAGEVKADLITVCSTCTYTDIASGISAANPGDQVTIMGDFNENVIVNKDITLRGWGPLGGLYSSTINGLVTVTADGATLEHLKVIPGNVTGQKAGISISASDVTVTDSYVVDMTGDGSGSIKGIYVYNDNTPALTNIVISGNKVENIFNDDTSGGYRGSSGIMVQGPLDGVDVLDNVILNITSDGWAYGIEVTPTGSSPANPPLNVLISDNEINSVNPTGGTTAAPWAGAGLSIDQYDASNTADASEVVLRYNQFLNTPVSVYNKDTVNTLDAKANWFGGTAEPANTNGLVAYNPWCYVDDCSELYVAEGGSIQDGIDLVKNSTVYVEAGTYQEQLVIDKAVSLIGPNAGTPGTGTRVAEAEIRFPSGLTGYQPLIEVTADNVSIDGFMIDGQDFPMATAYDDPDITDGILADASNFTAKNNIVKNFSEIGIFVASDYNTGLEHTGILIEDNLVTSDATGYFSFYSGIYVQKSYGTIQGNTIDKTYRGIQIQPYNHSNTANVQGLVQNNEIKAYRNPLYFNYSENSNSDWLFQNNTLEGNTVSGDSASRWDGLLIQTFTGGSVTFTGNTVNFGTTDATEVYPFGIINWPTTSTGTVDLDATFANNTFERAVVITDGTNIKKVQPDMAFYSTIQDAIDAASDGDTIYVAAGTYVEDVTNGTIDPEVLGKQVDLIGETDGSGDPLPVLQGSLVTSLDDSMDDDIRIENINFLMTNKNTLELFGVNGALIKNCTFDGNGVGIAGPWMGVQFVRASQNGNSDTIIEDCEFTNSLYSAIQGYVGNLTVKDSIISGVKSGINLQQTSGTLTVDGSDITAIAQAVDSSTYAIRSSTNVDITDSTLLVDKNGLEPEAGEHHSAIWLRDAGTSLIAHNNTIIGEVYNATTSQFDATLNWWGSVSGPLSSQIVEDPGDIIYCPWLDGEGGTTLYPVNNIDTLEGFCSIQAAIDDPDTSAGDTIEVSAGTYAEDLEIGKSITILGPNDTISPNTGTRGDEAILAPVDEVGVADTAILATASDITVTIKGLTLDLSNTTDNKDRFVEQINKTGNTWLFEHNIFTGAPETINGYWYITGTTDPTDITVVDNYFHHNGVSNGISLWGDGHTIDISDNIWKDNQGWAINVNNVTGTITNNQVLDVEDNGTEWYEEQAGFLFANTMDLTISGNLFDGLPNPSIRMYNTVTGTMTLTGNTFQNTMDDIGVIRISDGADLTGVIVNENLFLNNPINVQNIEEDEIENDTLDAEYNYWDSACGPLSGSMEGNVDYIPWYVDEAMSTETSVEPVSGTYTFPTTMSTIEKNAIIECAAPYTVFTFEVGTEAHEGGIIVNNDHLTFNINGAEIGSASPAFTINANYTVINGPGLLDGGGSSDHAIVVADGVIDFTLDTVEITGWADGLHFNGVITNTVIADNFIHDNTGHAVYFGAQPPTQTPVSFFIQGNMFKHNDGDGVYNAGATDVNAEYNSWSDFEGAAGEEDGDGATNADTDPFTHVDLYMVSTRPNVDEWPNQVFVDDADSLTPYDTITYQVKAHMENVTGASFVLEFDPTLIEVKEIVNNDYFPWPFNDPGYEGTVLDDNITYNNTEGWIAFDGASLTEVDGDIVLFEVTFTGLLPGEAVLDFDEATDEFAMSPGYGPSNNIYADELVDATLDVITRPTLEITGLDTPFVAGVMSHEIINTICNADTGGEWVDSIGAEPAPYDDEQDAIGWITITNVTSVDEVASLQYLYDGIWYDFEVQDNFGGTAVLYDEENDILLARFGNYNYGFEIKLDWCDIDAFRVTFAEPGTHDVTVEIYDMMNTPNDGIGDDDILLTYLGPVTIEVLGDFEVTGTIAMQGRTVRSGVPLTLTDVNGAPVYGPFTDDSGPELAFNVLFDGVNGSIFEITTAQPRYLNVHGDLDKQFLVNGPYTIDALELKGGNAKYSDNAIDISDASIVGGAYGIGDISSDGDVNFDNKVSIQDLALVGGNFGLTSEAAYAEWLKPEYNGSVSGIITDDGAGNIAGSVSGDYNLSITGNFTGESGGFAEFTGTVSGDFTGIVTGTVYERGTDPLYATITDTGADQTVRLVGAFVKSGINGHFKGEIITGPELDPVTDVTISGPTTVTVGDTIDLDVTTTPADRWVIWSVHANHTDYASIDQDGMLTGLAASPGTIEVIVVVIDDSNFSSQSYWVTVTAP